jgi:hypothetical protein
MGALTREWADMPVEWIPGTVKEIIFMAQATERAWCAGALCTSGPRAQSALWTSFMIGTMKNLFYFLFLSIDYSK